MNCKSPFASFAIVRRFLMATPLAICLAISNSSWLPSCHAAGVKPVAQHADDLPLPETEAAPNVLATDTNALLMPRGTYEKTLHSIVQIRVGRSSGTGWILDKENRWIVTSRHVVETAENAKIVFPTIKDGRPLTSPEDYQNEANFSKGTIVDSLQSIDLAIIQVDSLPEGSTALVLAQSSSMPGDRVHTIGGRPNASIGLWKYSTGVVSQISAVTMLIDDWIFSGHAMQSNIDINQGNSGGPIVNDEGEVVGVAMAIGKDVSASSYAVDLATLRTYLDEVEPLLISESIEDRIKLGRRHRVEGRYASARRYLTGALRQQPDSAEALAERGWTFLQTQDYNTASADFEEAIECNRTTSLALHGMARVQRHRSEFKEALKNISAAIANSSEDAELYHERAMIFQGLNSSDQAVADLNQAIELSPSNLYYRKERAELLMSIRQLDRARSDVVFALERLPSDAALHNLLGLIHLLAKDFSKAAQSFLQATKLDKSQPGYVNNLAAAMHELGAYEDSLAILSRAIKLSPKNKVFYVNRAETYYKLKRFQEAYEDVNRAIQLDGKFAAAIHLRGQIQQQLGRDEEYRKDLILAAQLDPENFGSANTNRLADK